MLSESRLTQPRLPRIQSVGHDTTRHATWLKCVMNAYELSKCAQVLLISFINHETWKYLDDCAARYTHLVYLSQLGSQYMDQADNQGIIPYTMTFLDIDTHE